MNEKVRTNTELLEEISLLSQRIKVLEQSESELMLRDEVFQARQRLHDFTPNHSIEELLRKTLDEIEVLTDSQIGFFHFVSADERTIYLQTWSTNTLEKMCTAEGSQKHYGVDQAGVWVDCVHQRQAVIHNDYASLPHRKGMPQGHAPVIRVLVVPVIQYGRIVAILGVGNKPNDYSPADVSIVSALALLAWDVHERRRAEDALRESEKKHRTLVENIPQKIFTKDRNSVYVSCNENFARDLGINPEEFIGKNDYDYFPRDLADKYRADDKRIMESGETRNIEERYMQDGKALWVNTIKTPIRDVQGNITGILGVFNDITERKLAEEKLREKEERYRSLIDAISQSNIGLFLVDADYRVRFMNQQLVATFGDQTGNICYEGLGKASSPCDYCKLDEVLQLRKIVHYQPTTPIGKTYDIVAVPFIDTDGAMCKLEILQDITERKRAEEQLRFQAQIIENSPIIAAYHDKELNMVWANRAYQKVTGLSLEEIRGRKCYQVWNLSKPCRGCPVITAVETGESAAYELTPDNQDHWPETQGYWLSQAAPIRDEQGTVIGAIEFAIDITERKRSELALRESEQRFMDVLYASSDAVLLIDGEQFVDCNEATARMLGYSTRNEFLQTHPSELSPPTQPDGRNSFEKASEMMRIASEEGFHQFEWDHRRANGEDFPVEVSLTSIVFHGKNVIHCMWRDISERKRAEEELRLTFESLRKAVATTMQVMVSAVEARDPYTSGHQLRVADIARAIATKMGLSQEKIDGIRIAGSIHDIGKLSIPAEILSKPSKLSALEFSLIKEHARKGYEMLKDVESSWPLAQIVYQHHERMDGSGYPRNLKGDEILMEARIMAVADVVEAMASHRPYRPGLGIDAALNEIEKNKGIFYDKNVAEACLRLFREKGFQIEQARY